MYNNQAGEGEGGPNGGHWCSRMGEPYARIYSDVQKCHSYSLCFWDEQILSDMCTTCEVHASPQLGRHQVSEQVPLE